MKKKLLSLVLAGAMVASTSVSAFAAENGQNYDIGEEGQDHRVTITGDIEDAQGTTVPGTISVTVPTAVSFAIDKSGKFSAGTIEVVNRNTNQDKVEVVVKKFTDTNPTGGIVLVKESDLDSASTVDSDNKKHVSLKLTGDTSVQLVSNSGNAGTGLVDASGAEIQKDANTSLGEAWNGTNLKLKLTGRTKSTYDAPTQGNSIKNEFNLLLKIQKTTKK